MNAADAPSRSYRNFKYYEPFKKQDLEMVDFGSSHKKCLPDIVYNLRLSARFPARDAFTPTAMSGHIPHFMHSS